MRCLQPWFGTGRVAILDAGFGSVETVKALKEYGLHCVGNVKQISDGFPRAKMLGLLKKRHDSCHYETTVPVGDSGQSYKLYASGH